jgi:peptidoglycan hydrolase CwlO-like protein
MLNIKLTFIPLLSLLLLVTVSQAGKAEPVYTVFRSELTDMKHYLAIIRQENQNLLNDLKSCKISLQQAEERRLSLENQLNELSNKYQLLSEERSELETLLKELQESFAQSKKEAQTRIRRLVIQRNVCLILGVIAILL